MIYIDEELVPKAVHDGGFATGMTFAAWSGAPVDLFTSVNPIYTELRRGLVRYQQAGAACRRFPIPDGPTLKAGHDGRPRGDAAHASWPCRQATSSMRRSPPKVKEFQAVHGLKADGIAGAGTIDALNRGAQYYEQLIIINMERAKRLPAPEEQRKYAIVDAGDARLRCGRTAARSTR